MTVGDSGVPNGFVIEWMTVADFIANGNQWPDNPDEVCQASFSNSLAPNQTMAVVVGDDRLFDSFDVRSDCSGDPILPAQRCHAIRDKIARIRRAIGKTIPTFGRCKA